MTKTMEQELAGVTERLRQAEEILTAAIDQDRDLTYAETVFLQSDLAMTEPQIRAERRRVRSVLRYKAIAGTKAARKKVYAAPAKATAKLDASREHLEEQIRKAQAELDGLVRARDSAVRRSEEVADAEGKLRDLLPPGVMHAYNQRKRAIGNTTRKRLQEVKSRLREIEDLSAMDIGDPKNVTHLKVALNRPGEKSVTVATAEGEKVDPELAAQRIAELAARQSELQDEHEELRGKYADQMDELDQVRDYYLQD